MIVALFRRRLKPGMTFDDFKRAWEAERGFGVPARVLSAVSIADPSEILTVGLVDIDPAEMATATERVAEQEHKRHDLIAEVIESTELRAFYELRAEHDFSGDPREIEIGSAESLLQALGVSPGHQPDAGENG